MKVVKVEILPAKDGEVVTAVVYEQSKSGQTWKDGDKHTVKSGTPEASFSLLLDDNERIVIEGAAMTQLVVDPVQSSVHEIPLEQPPEVVPQPKAEESDVPMRGRSK